MTEVKAAPNVSTARGERRLWWLPREHGAWVQLALPQLTWCLGAASDGGGWMFAGAVAAVFVAHEPFAVAFGHRGSRARRAHGRVAGWLAVVLAVAAAVLAWLSLVPAATSARLGGAWLALLPAAALGLGFGVVAAQGRARTGGGEGLAAAALAAASIPTGLLVGASWGHATRVAALWATVFGAETAAARVVLARGKKGGGVRGSRVALVVVALAVVALGGWVAASLAGLASWHYPAAFAPTLGVVAVAALARVGPRQLMAVGLSMLVAGLGSLALLTLAS